MMFIPRRKHAYGPSRLVTDVALLFYVDDVRTSQEEQASTACYRDSFTFLYVDNVHTSQEARLWTFTACYRDSFFLYVDYVRTSQKAQASTACNRDSFIFLYVDDVPTSQEARLWAFMVHTSQEA
jgi:hypothetical protein